MLQTERARVFRNGRSQAVRIPAQYRFQTDSVYVRRDPVSGALTLSEKPFPKKTAAEIFADLDAAGAADFVLERDHSPAPDLDLF
jgi:antitoxin VapB